MSPFIEDGFCLRFSLKLGDKVVLTGEYRPATLAERYRWNRDRMASKDDASDLQIDLAYLKEHLVSWDAGRPIETKSLSKVWPVLQSQLLDHVNGYTMPQMDGTSEQDASEKN